MLQVSGPSSLDFFCTTSRDWTSIIFWLQRYQNVQTREIKADVFWWRRSSSEGMSIWRPTWSQFPTFQVQSFLSSHTTALDMLKPMSLGKPGRPPIEIPFGAMLWIAGQPGCSRYCLCPRYYVASRPAAVGYPKCTEIPRKEAGATSIPTSSDNRDPGSPVNRDEPQAQTRSTHCIVRELLE